MPPSPFATKQMMCEHVPDAPLAIRGGVDEAALYARGRLRDEPLLDGHLHCKALVRVHLHDRPESAICARAGLPHA